MLDGMNKDVVAQVRITAEEHQKWQTAAEQDGRSLSNWIRHATNDYLSRQPPAEFRASVHKAAAERATRLKKGGR